MFYKRIIGLEGHAGLVFCKAVVHARTIRSASQVCTYTVNFVVLKDT